MGNVFLPTAHRKDVDEKVDVNLKGGADVNALDSQNNTPLHYSVIMTDAKTIQKLLLAGANPNIRNTEGLTPLHVICSDDSRDGFLQLRVVDIIDLLLKGGANVNALDGRYNTPLHYLVGTNHRPMTNNRAIRKLLLAGANPNAFNTEGLTPFHYACLFHPTSTRLTKIFLNSGADVNLSNSNGVTPLRMAVEEVKLVHLLIEHGANVRAGNLHNATRFQLMYFDNKDMFKYIVLWIASGKYQLTDWEVFRRNTSRPRVDFRIKKMYKDYLTCATEMKTYFIGGSSITLFDFLLLPNERASRYLRNPDILSDLTNLPSSPRWDDYSSMIKNKLTDALVLRRLLDRTTLSLEVVFSPFQFPERIIEKILSFLEEDDMESINCAVNTEIRLPRASCTWDRSESEENYDIVS